MKNSSKWTSISWFHSIDLGDGVVTEGASEIQIPEEQLSVLRRPKVLDIGAWDGYYSFMAERLGARRVWRSTTTRGVWTSMPEVSTGPSARPRAGLPDLSLDLTEFWRPELPGRTGV